MLDQSTDEDCIRPISAHYGRWPNDLTLRRSFRIAAFNAPRSDFTVWNKAEIDDCMNMFEIAISNVLDRVLGLFARRHPSCARRCCHVRNSTSHSQEHQTCRPAELSLFF
jgi:hypothetical protein